MQENIHACLQRRTYEPAPAQVFQVGAPVRLHHPAADLRTGPARVPSGGLLARGDAHWVPTDRGGEGPAPAGHASQRSERVLVVDDDEMHQRVAAAMLASAGFLVQVVSNGALAVDALMRRPYDVILMDCEMPELDGYGATRKIRLLSGYRRHTPIVAVTTRAGEEERQRCLAAGMDDFLTKPVGKDALVETVVRWNQLGWVRRRNAGVHSP